MLKLIAAMGLANRVIGNNGEMPWVIHGELQHFRHETLYQTVIMGRTTFESIGGKPLDKRRNYVMTRNGFSGNSSAGNLWFKSSVRDIVIQARNTPSMNFYVMGGEEIYREYLPYADELVLTSVWRKDGAVIEGDAYFPRIKSMDWETKDQSPVYDEGEFEYQIHWLTRREESTGPVTT